MLDEKFENFHNMNQKFEENIIRIELDEKTKEIELLNSKIKSLTLQNQALELALKSSREYNKDMVEFYDDKERQGYVSYIKQRIARMEWIDENKRRYYHDLNEKLINKIIRMNDYLRRFEFVTNKEFDNWVYRKENSDA